MNTNRKKGISFTIPILIIVLVAGYFVYKGFFSNSEVTLSEGSNSYLSQTKLGKNIEIINKENISFNTNINNNTLKEAEDFSLQVFPSLETGRSNPFLP